MTSSDQPSMSLAGTHWQNASTRPSAERVTDSMSPVSCGSNRRESVMENPRSSSPRRDSSLIATISPRSAGSRVVGSWNVVVYPARATRLTAWRSDLCEPPAVVNVVQSTMASSPR